MKKIKTRRDKDMWGELVFGTDNTPSAQYLKMVVNAYEREYSKAFNIYRLKLENRNQDFKTLADEPMKLIGMFDQKLMLVQRTDTGRYYRLPTVEVVAGFEYTKEMEQLETTQAELGDEMPM